MKVKHVLMIAAVLLAMFVAPVVAEDTTDIGAESDAVYSFQIPDDFDFKSTEAGAKQTDKVSVDIESIDPKNVVEVSVTSPNAEGSDLYLKHVSGTGYRLLYTMTVGGNPVGNGGVVISTDYDAEEEVIFTLEETATKSGRYEDTLTFTAQMVEIESDGYSEQAVYTKDELQNAINAATGETTITLGADITGDVIVPQKAGVKITIDGDGKTFDGYITVDGKSSRYDDAALTIRNVNFEADSSSTIDDAFIRLGDGTTATYYTNHVTVKDCTFTYSGNDDVVAIKSYKGGDKNLVLDGCTVVSGLHSLLQVQNVEEGLKVIDCTIQTAEEGINLNQCYSLEMSGCNFNTDTYAVRFGATAGGTYGLEMFSITDSTLTASCNGEGMGVIVFRTTAQDATLTLTDVTLSGTTAIAGNTGATTIIQAVDTADELTAAINAGYDVILTDDVVVPVDKSLTIENGQQIVLDLNGHTISGTCNSGQGWLMFVENSAILTIKDSIGSGKLKFTKGTSGTGWVIDLEGKLVLESGTIELAGNGWDIGYCVDVRPNAWGTAYTEPTIFTMNGGKLVSSDGAVRVASSSSDTYSDVSASFVMTNGEIDAAYDGIFIQQSNGAYDTLSFTMTGGSIISDNYLIRFYGPEPTSYISGNQKCMSLTLNVDVSALTGPAEPLTGKTWLIENVIALGGGMTSDIIDNTATITLDDSFN